MTPADAIVLASSTALGMLGLALFLTVYRIVVGPTLADRVLALDLLTVLGMGFVGALAIRTGITLYIDIAIALALLGFLATVAFARYILSRAALKEKP
jgi:multicomponent Na+:H+ antiporter subunit F